MSNIKSTTKSPEEAFTIVDPNTGKQYTNTWAFSKESLNRMIEEDRILWKETLPKQKEFLYEMTNENKAIKSSWGVFDAQSTTVFLKQIVPSIKFDNPKPIKLLNRIIEVATRKDSIILDSFSGSGTTAHAVLNTNKFDGGNRRFILVEMEYYAENLTAERVRRAIDGYGEGNKAVEGTSGDFTFYELGRPLLLPDGNLNEAVEAEKIREYVWYMETKRPMKPVSSENPYYLGNCCGTGYYFYYERYQLTTLNHQFLNTIQDRAESYLIYADLCTIPDEELKKYNITFKKIPRDIQKL